MLVASMTSVVEHSDAQPNKYRFFVHMYKSLISSIFGRNLCLSQLKLSFSKIEDIQNQILVIFDHSESSHQKLNKNSVFWWITSTKVSWQCFIELPKWGQANLCILKIFLKREFVSCKSCFPMKQMYLVSKTSSPFCSFLLLYSEVKQYLRLNKHNFL